MFIKDSDIVDRHVRLMNLEKQLIRVQRWADEQLRCVEVDDDDLSTPGNWERQTGRKMTVWEFERHLKNISPKYSITKEKTPAGGAVWFDANDTRHLVSPCNWPEMPEHSFMRVHYELVRDMSFILENKLAQHIDGADLPKYEYNRDGTIEFDPAAVPPGWRRSKQLRGEIMRGWRTILLHAVKKGFMTINEAEKEFDPDNRIEWAQHTGRAPLTTPW